MDNLIPEVSRLFGSAIGGVDAKWLRQSKMRKHAQLILPTFSKTTGESLKACPLQALLRLWVETL